MNKIVFHSLLILCSAQCWAQYSSDQIADAIYRAEGGSKAKYLYGIVSVKYKDASDARRICLKTIEHAKRDYLKLNRFTGRKGLRTLAEGQASSDFIEFLGSRYCPVGASNDPKGLNKNWVKNVKHFLRKN